MRSLREINFKEAHLDAMASEDFEQYRPIIMADSTLKFTLAHKGIVVCLLACHEYAPNKYMGFLMASDFLRSSLSRDVREFVKDKFLSYNMDRLETLSVVDKSIDRWHEFLGFELEGVKKRYLNNQDYKMWGMV